MKSAPAVQPEYGKPVGEYVNGIVSAGNISTGIRKEKEWRATFDAVEQKYGVERWVLLAIWGMETSYGALKDKWDVFRSLATLAWLDATPVAVAITAAEGGSRSYVDPSPRLDSSGRIVLFYLASYSSSGDPAQCASGETSCYKYFRSATESGSSAS